MNGSAVFSTCEPKPLFRKRLDRWWSDEPRALVGMANPSRAGAEDNDPTIGNLVRLLRPLPGIGGFTVVNWETYIATDPKDLYRWRNCEAEHFDPERRAAYNAIRGANIALIRELSETAAIRIVAWGNLVPLAPQTTKILQAMSLDGTRDLYAFETTKDGSPKHPMARGQHRIPDGTVPTVWRAGRIAA